MGDLKVTETKEYSTDEGGSPAEPERPHGPGTGPSETAQTPAEETPAEETDEDAGGETPDED